MSAGKGSRPRNCFTDKFREGYDQIKFPKKEQTKKVLDLSKNKK
jgi:hypothetical protein